jgi:hypothetical protein
MRKRRATQLAFADLMDAAKPAAKPKQRYVSTDARREYQKLLMRKRRAAASRARNPLGDRPAVTTAT